MRLACLFVITLITTRVHADTTVLATTPREQAFKLFQQAKKMFADEDWIAAAVTFGQAQAILARVDRDPSGKVVDDEAHKYRNAALSNKATSYSRGGLYVDAFNAFVELRDQFGGELTKTEREEIDEAIARMAERIGSVKLSGLPDEGEVEVRFDGRLERRDLHAPLKMSEGDHSIDVEATGFRPYVAEFTVVRQQELALAVALEPLKTPARLRVEASVGARVAIDGTERGDAPVEISLPPGTHHIVVAAESYVTQTSDVELRPDERSVVRVGMVRARASIGLRLEPAYIASFPLRTDTPFGSYGGGIGLDVFHDTLRVRNVRFGLSLEHYPRRLNSEAIGVVGTWCPDRFAGRLVWCPVEASASYVFGDHDGVFATGEGRLRGLTAVEARYRSGFARASAGITVENYARDYPLVSGTGFTVLILWASVVELSLGVDL